MPPDLPPRLHLQLLRREAAEQLAAAAEMRRQAAYQRANAARTCQALERMSEETWADLTRARRIRPWWEE